MCSEVFRLFVQKYPDSGPAREWAMWGEAIPEHSGSFTTALFTGDLVMATRRADVVNRELLKGLLFPERLIRHEG